MDKENLRSKKTIIWLAVAISICAIIVTYAAYQYSKQGNRTHEITTGTLKLHLNDAASNGISINPAKPLTEEEGLATTEYAFVLENDGNTTASYRIGLIDDEEKYSEHGCYENKMPHTVLKTAITKNGGDEQIEMLSESDEKGYFDLGELEPGGRINYTLKIWIDESADNEIQGTHFHGKVKLEGIVKGNGSFDTGE